MVTTLTDRIEPIHKMTPVYKVTPIDPIHRVREYHQKPSPDDYSPEKKDEESRPDPEGNLGQSIDTMA